MKRITVKNTYWLDKNVYKLNDCHSSRSLNTILTEKWSASMVLS